MLKKEATYEQSRAGFRWQVPERYNIGVDICDKWADLEPDRIAIIDVEEDLSSTQLSFGALKSRSNQLANALCAYGIQGKGDQRACDGDDAIGDRIGVLLPQSIETALAHIAALKMGCVSIPLFTLFGEEALRHRLQDSGARLVVTNREGAIKLSALRQHLPQLELVLYQRHKRLTHRML